MVDNIALMGINFESGEFSRRQHRLEDDQVFPMVKEVKSHPGVYVAYVDVDGLRADEKKAMDRSMRNRLSAGRS